MHLKWVMGSALEQACLLPNLQTASRVNTVHHENCVQLLHKGFRVSSDHASAPLKTTVGPGVKDSRIQMMTLHDLLCRAHSVHSRRAWRQVRQFLLEAASPHTHLPYSPQLLPSQLPARREDLQWGTPDRKYLLITFITCSNDSINQIQDPYKKELHQRRPFAFETLTQNTRGRFCIVLPLAEFSARPQLFKGLRFSEILGKKLLLFSI